MKVSGDPGLPGDQRSPRRRERRAHFVAEFGDHDGHGGDSRSTTSRARAIDRTSSPSTSHGGDRCRIALARVRALPSATATRWSCSSPCASGLEVSPRQRRRARARPARSAHRSAAERFGMPMTLPNQAALTKAGLGYRGACQQTNIVTPRCDREDDGRRSSRWSATWSGAGQPLRLARQLATWRRRRELSIAGFVA